MKFDYVIVGAGSAGCVLANRLTSDHRYRVLLVEAGPENKALSLKIPAALLSNLKSKRHNWAYPGEPEPELGGRQLQHDRGKTLGGSSSINGMVFIRGHAMDFEGWRQLGCSGWGYADVLPYFKRLESYEGGGDEFRGDDGPLRVHRPEPRDPIALAFANAGAEAGYPLTDDICGYRQEGFGVLDSTVSNGERWSAARGYLDPARSRPNLKIVTGCHVHRILVEDRKANGIEYLDNLERNVSVSADKEVILSAGAVGTPQLLMLSGIGPGEQLRSLGIDVVADLPGVGQNLNDHPDFVLKYKCLKPVSIWPKTKPIARVFEGLKWLVSRKGVCASNHFDTVGCVRSGPDVDYPDLQFTITPIAVDDKTWEPIPEHAFQIHVGLMRAYSRGKIELRDANPASPPRILANYLQDERDRYKFYKGIRIVRELVGQPAFNGLCGREIFPGSHVQSNDDLDKCLDAATVSQWHLSGTARMGSDADQGAVVDASGKVHGVSGLRIVDASIMPVVTNGNTNGPTIMIAEKLSDAILNIPALPRIEEKFWMRRESDSAPGR
ncbi:MAG: choline dehydrogenase [Albidovulum sp.]|nr:choline dehydrogenase [Albidovulum sp.]